MRINMANGDLLPLEDLYEQKFAGICSITQLFLFTGPVMNRNWDLFRKLIIFKI